MEMTSWRGLNQLLRTATSREIEFHFSIFLLFFGAKAQSEYNEIISILCESERDQRRSNKFQFCGGVNVNNRLSNGRKEVGFIEGWIVFFELISYLRFSTSTGRLHLDFRLPGENQEVIYMLKLKISKLSTPSRSLIKLL
jgi:hypothetical protein